ncbi:hypothetical protein VLF92_13395, partial [Pseudomonas chengduensis]
LSVSYYTTISTAEVTETVRHTAALQQSDGTEWSVEELIAMQLSYVKNLAESVAGGKSRRRDRKCHRLRMAVEF